MMAGRLSGKVCIITGTGGSVGRSAALAFAHEDASVVGCDVNVSAAEATAEMVRAQGGTIISLQPCHLTEPSECQALVDLAVREYGRIDVLFNNAAMAYFNWLEDITNEEWNRDLREEIDLVFFLTRATWPYLKASHGVVVNTASLNGPGKGLIHGPRVAGLRCIRRVPRFLVLPLPEYCVGVGRRR